MVFHVATMMTSESKDESQGVPSVMKQKRHIGNDFVHVVFKVRGMPNTSHCIGKVLTPFCGHRNAMKSTT